MGSDVHFTINVEILYTSHPEPTRATKDHAITACYKLALHLLIYTNINGILIAENAKTKKKEEE